MHISKSSQRFSGTDLSTNHLTETGVVFPLASGNNKPNFAGIMEHRGGAYQQNMLARCEYRIANGAINTEINTPITYEKGRCIAIVLDPTTTTPSESEKLLNIQPITASYATLDALSEASLESNLLTMITSLWEKHPLTPMTDFIDKINVEQKPITRTLFNYMHIAQNTNLAITTLAKSSTELKYIDAAKQIKWLTSEEKTTVSRTALLLSVKELSNFFYGEDECDTTIEFNSRSVLLEEYNSLEKLIKSEIEQDAEEALAELEYAKLLVADEPEEELDEEDMYMLTALLQAGVPTTNLTTPTEILNAYCVLTSKATYGQLG